MKERGDYLERGEEIKRMIERERENRSRKRKRRSKKKRGRKKLNERGMNLVEREKKRDRKMCEKKNERR